MNVVMDVINGVREAFLDEGMDEQVLQELKQLWESKLVVSKAIETNAGPDQKHSESISLQQAVAQVTLPAHQQMLRAPPAHHTQQPHYAGHPQQQFGQMVGIPHHMTASAQTAANALPASIYQQQLNQLSMQPSFVLQPGGHPVQPDQKSSLVTKPVIQLDGVGDSSSEDDLDNQDDDDDDDNDDDANDDEAEAEEENPLNSEDDVSDSDPTEVFDAENVIVCQFDKINRSKNRWKFHLKDGIMNLNGKDQLFQKATGDAEW